MSEISLKNITKRYENNQTIFEDFSVTFPSNEFIAILGPSGCGKSTLLRMISGLEEFDQGQIFVDGEDISRKDPKDRNIAMVFQNYALYPHKTVYKNMEFGMKMRKVPKAERQKRIEQAAAMLDIEDLLKRLPGELSGGQRQRVALGRALVRDPKLFLLDEPLSNLDAKLRVKMRSEIIELYHQIGRTMIYVTHDQTEAMTMGTRILLLDKGRIQQYDAPNALYDRPANLFVAQFIGSPQMNVYSLPIKDGQVAFGTQSLIVPLDYPHDQIFLGFRAEDAQLVPGDQFTVSHTENLGNEHLIYLEGEGQSICVRDYSKDLLKLGEKIGLQLDPENLHWFDSMTEERVDPSNEDQTNAGL